jgi:lysozyme
MTPEILIKDDEGLLLKPYRCSEHKLTIGYGYNMEANPLPKHIEVYLNAHGSITKEMADELFEGKYTESVVAARNIIGNAWSFTNEVRRAVIISMIYQMGEAGFRKFVNTIKYIKATNWIHAAYQMLQSKWEDQTEDRAHRYALMMATGLWLIK